MSDTSRRAVMASIATASVASAGAIATPAVINPATDPIFAAITASRRRRGLRDVGSRLRPRR